MTGASGTAFTGDALSTSSGWRVALAGGYAGTGDQVGALCLGLAYVSSFVHPALSGRLAYAA